MLLFELEFECKAVFLYIECFTRGYRNLESFETMSIEEIAIGEMVHNYVSFRVIHY